MSDQTRPDGRTREARAMREAETRTAEAHADVWKPNALLPDPLPRDGIRFRWVRTSVRGTPDTTNVSTRFREGWVAVKKADFPELADVLTDFNSRFPENVEIGGLLLCQIDEKRAAARQQSNDLRARQQVQAADQNFMREQDPRMPLLKTERNSRTTFGGGQPPR